MSWAAAKGQLNALIFLLEEGVRHDDPDGANEMPLMLAARNGHSVAGETLLNLGRHCDLQTRDSYGDDALALAARRDTPRPSCGCFWPPRTRGRPEPANRVHGARYRRRRRKR